MTECKVCLLGSEMPGVVIEQDGRCNWCHWQDQMERDHTPDPWKIREITKQIKAKRKGSYDCVIGISGGADSSYLLDLVVREGLRPLAVTMDDTWNDQKACANIERMTNELGVDLETIVLGPQIDDIYASFIKASVPDLGAPTDMAIIKCLYNVAQSVKTKYILDAHDFRSEATMPLGWFYFDGAYIKDVHHRYGTMPMGDFPNLTFVDQMKYTAMGFERPRLLYYVKKTKQQRMEELQDKFEWVPYGEKHAENAWTEFNNYVWQRKFGLNWKDVYQSALIRSGQLSRAGAMTDRQPRIHETALIRTVAKRTGVSRTWLEQELNVRENVSCRDRFKTNKELFRKTRAFWWVAMKTGRVPETFYRKYCDAE